MQTRPVQLFFLLTCLATFSAHGQDPTLPGFVRDSLDSYIQQALQDWQIPGVAVGIVKDGQVLLVKGYGVKELGVSDPVDANTLFMIGSNTKLFTATSLAMLDAEKKLSLDDPVTKWLPHFKLHNAAAGQQAIITDLLCHRIGFRTFQGDFTYWTSNLSREEVTEKMSHIQATYPFRTTWGYTNAAFLTAGQIIPRATGTSWEDFVRVRIFAPLGMSRTLALSRELPAATNKAAPYTMSDYTKLVKIPYCQIDNLAPAGSISSSVKDLSKWVIMQLANGQFAGKQVVPEIAIAKTRRPQSIEGNWTPPFNEGHFRLYGLGVELQEYNGKEIVSHTGGVNGFVSSLTMIPEERLGIIVLTNSDQNEFYQALKWEILDAFLGLPFRNYSKFYLVQYTRETDSVVARDRQLKDSAALHLKTTLPILAYTGEYVNGVYGTMKVVREEGELRMRFAHHPAMYAKLEPLGGNRFYATFSDPEFSKAIFPFSTSGQQVKSVTVKVADFVEYNAYEFTKTK
jgi:CubicO group peptidase (beta-lactamase class C family)